MKRYTPVALFAAAATLSVACDVSTPTSSDPGLIPVAPTTVEVRIPFSDFGRDVKHWAGFGRVADLSTAILADGFDGTLHARTVVRFGAFPTFVSVADSSGIVVSDSTVTYVGGRILARVDTTTVAGEGPFVVTASALRGGRWDPRSVTWAAAVDTVGDVREWPEEGAGPAEILDTISWNPAEGDSVVFDVDSATINQWADTTDGTRGLRVDLTGPGGRIEVAGFLLNLDIRPSANPDTVVSRPVGPTTVGFVYSPPPPPPESELRAGGAPSWRTTFGVTLADTLFGPPELCDVFGCPFLLTSESVNFAALTLQSATSPSGFQPDDSLSVDLRAVISEEALPKSPLSGSLAPGLTGLRVPADYFGDEPDGQITIGVTSFVQDLIRGETLLGSDAPTALSLLTPLEPLSMELMTFAGMGSEREPVLRLILTTRVGVPLR